MARQRSRSSSINDAPRTNGNGKGSGRYNRRATAPGGGLLSFAVIFLLLIGLGGGGYYFYLQHQDGQPSDYDIYQAERERKLAELENQDKKTPAVPAPSPRDTNTTSNRIAALPPNAATPGPMFQSKIDAALPLFKEGHFGEAGDLLDEALKLNPPEQEQEKFSQHLATARLFAQTVDEIKPDVESTAENLFVFSLKNGGQFTAKVLTENTSELMIKKDGGITANLPRKEILAMDPVSQKKRDQQMLDEIIQRKTECETGLDYYHLAIYALECNFSDRAHKYLLKSASLDKDIARSVYEERAHSLFARAIWSKSRGMRNKSQRQFEELAKKYPESQAARQAQQLLAEADAAIKRELEEQRRQRQRKRELLAMADKQRKQKAATAKRRREKHSDAAISLLKEEEPEVPAEPPSGIERGSADRVALSKPDKLMAEADELFAKASGGGKGSRKQNNKLYKEAAKKYREARNAYNEYLTAHPDPAVEQKLAMACEQLHWSKKLQTVE